MKSVNKFDGNPLADPEFPRPGWPARWEWPQFTKLIIPLLMTGYILAYWLYSLTLLTTNLPVRIRPLTLKKNLKNELASFKVLVPGLLDPPMKFNLKISKIIPCYLPCIFCLFVFFSTGKTCIRISEKLPGFGRWSCNEMIQKGDQTKGSKKVIMLWS